ncbi:MAG: polysaccharide deacetylase family protein [Eubacteriales bacterium]|nr:polysaccharide deacetylase family protein [Eubacteriales bacterium]
MNVASTAAFGRKLQSAALPCRELQSPEQIDPSKPMVTLTFDDGPSLLYTPEILDILKQNNAVATFFILGIQAEENPEVLAQILEGGNQIGIHSYNHESFLTLSDERLKYQIETPQEIVITATGYTPSLLRPPYGFINEDVIAKVPMPIILWSIDTLDWENRNVNVIYNNIFENIQDGDIILMHDIFESSVEAARVVIPELIKRGYQLVTVSDLAKYREAELQPHNVYSNF